MRTFKATEFTAVDRYGDMTLAELETLAWMAEGKDNRAIGMLRGHGVAGAKKLVTQVLDRFQCYSRCHAVARATATGYLKCHRAAELTIELTIKHPRHMVAAGLIVTGGWLGAASEDHDMSRRAPSQIARIVRGGPRTRLEGLIIEWGNA